MVENNQVRVSSGRQVSQQQPQLGNTIILIALAVVLAVAVLWFFLGRQEQADGQRVSNGIWLSQRWWGDNDFFNGSWSEEPADYRGEANAAQLAARMSRLGISDWYISLGPTSREGTLPKVNEKQARILVDANRDGDVLAAVTGWLKEQYYPGVPWWRPLFAKACADLMSRTGIAGIQIVIQPMPSQEPGLIELVTELRNTLPEGARISVVAHPPPSELHPVTEVHWNEEFYRTVSAQVDDICVTPFNTSVTTDEEYARLVEITTRQVLPWSSCPVRIGVPAYDFTPRALLATRKQSKERLPNALTGLSAALADGKPDNYAGWAVYGDWYLDEAKEKLLEEAR